MLQLCGSKIARLLAIQLSESRIIYRISRLYHRQRLTDLWWICGGSVVDLWWIDAPNGNREKMCGVCVVSDPHPNFHQLPPPPPSSHAFKNEVQTCNQHLPVKSETRTPQMQTGIELEPSASAAVKINSGGDPQLSSSAASPKSRLPSSSWRNSRLSCAPPSQWRQRNVRSRNVNLYR